MTGAYKKREIGKKDTDICSVRMRCEGKGRDECDTFTGQGTRIPSKYLKAT